MLLCKGLLTTSTIKWFFIRNFTCKERVAFFKRVALFMSHPKVECRTTIRRSFRRNRTHSKNYILFLQPGVSVV